MVVIVNYKMGNLGSIRNMLKRIGVMAVISSDPAALMEAERLILPGVGAFDTGMRNIRALGLEPVLAKKVLDERTPILGICLGMQLLTQRSEEGVEAGLGWIEGGAVRFRVDKTLGLKVPHMGWNTLAVVRPGALFDKLDGDPDLAFYFVHSYHLASLPASVVLATALHGYDFPAAVQADNIMGTQFHPEKSHKYGIRLLQNFVEYEPRA